MKLKLDANGNVVLSDGKPVYITDDGKEFVADVPDMHSKLIAAGNEARTYRTERDAATAALKPFEGIDAKAARDALATVKDIKDGQLIAAGKVEEVRQEIKTAFEGRISTLETENTGLKGKLNTTRLTNAFANAAFVKDKLLLPVDIVQATFGNRFEFDANDRIVAKDNGNIVYSKKKPGEPADFEEALEILVDSYPHKATILKGANQQGSGNQGQGGNQGGKKSMTRTEFEKLPPSQAAAFSKEMGAGTAVLTD